MTKRERFLIMLLSAAVILLGGFKVLVEPQVKALAEADRELTRVREEHEEHLRNVALMPTLEEANANLRQTAGENAARFFPSLSHDEIHRFFAELARKSGVTFQRFDMTEITLASVRVPADAGAGLRYPLKDAADYLGGRTARGELPAASDSQNADLLETLTVTVEFRASYAVCKRFVQAVADSGKTAAVTEISMNAVSDGVVAAKATIRCYGTAKIDETKPRAPAGTGKADPFR